MKHEKLFAMLWSILLTALITASSIACLTTGFRMPEHLAILLSGTQMPWVDWELLMLSCITLSALFSYFQRKTVAFCVLEGLLILLALGLELVPSVESLLYYVSLYYDSAYGIGVIQWSVSAPYGEMTVALIALAALIAFAVSNTLCRKGPVIPALILAALPLAACLVCTDTLPDTLYIYMLLLGLTVLVLTSAVRRQSQAQSNRLVILTILPAALVLGLLFGVAPQEGYDRQPALPQWLSGLFGKADVTVTGEDNLEFEDLTKDGHYVNLNQVVMEVTSSQSQVLYLRGQAKDIYTGTTWETGTGSNGFFWPSRMRMRDGGRVTIRTQRAQKVLYLPYYADALPTYQTDNEANYTEYTLSYDTLAESDYQFLQTDVRYTIGCELPSETYQWAAPLAKEITQGLTLPLDRMDAILQYVRRSAEYYIRTPGMPESETDFARWFLEQSDTGYCVHFATAAAVLLRAAGIPARYVTGYMVPVRAGEETAVQNRNAHAWVEVFISGVGWLPMDPTPVNEEEQSPDTTEDVHTTETSETPPETETTLAETTTLEQTSSQTGEQTIQTETAPGGKMPVQPRPAMELALQIVCALVLLVALTLAQWRLRVALLRKKLRRGSTNRQAIAHWQQVQRVAKHLKEEPQPPLLELAEKAKFSHHAITDREIAEFDRYLRAGYARLKKKPWYCRVVYTLILAIY